MVGWEGFVWGGLDLEGLYVVQRSWFWLGDLLLSDSVLTSVGIDIGTTTTHLVFSRLLLHYVEQKRKFEVFSREITFRSKVAFTPYEGTDTVDIGALSSILLSAYEDAGQKPSNIDAGAVIITGEAAKKHNAERIVNLFAGEMGEFVCATAGANYEAVLAAYGSGAVQQSLQEGVTIMNIDVGGGTTKLAVVRRGEVVDTAAIAVGAHLVVFDGEGRVLRVEDAAKTVADAAGVRIEVGKPLPKADQQRMAASFSTCLSEMIGRGQRSNLTEELLLTPPLRYESRIDKITFSGGVSEYIYGYIDQEFGDLGRVLAEEIEKAVAKTGIPVSEPVERIRATVIGVSHYTLQVSGNTTFISDPRVLPVRNLPVVAPNFVGTVLTPEAMKEEIGKALKMHDIVDGRDDFALAFSRSVITQPSYAQMRALGEAVVSALSNTIKEGKTVVLVFEADIGLGMGRVIKNELEPHCSLVSVDEIALQDFNFIDIGEPEADRTFLPVVVKSLVFPDK